VYSIGKKKKKTRSKVRTNVISVQPICSLT